MTLYSETSAHDSQERQAVYYTAEMVRNLSLPVGIKFLNETTKTTDLIKNDVVQVG